MRQFGALCMLITATLLSGCATEAKITKVDPLNSETAVGVPHPLMFSRYPLTLRWQVTKCDATAITLALGADLAPPQAFPDPDNLFVIDPSSLSTPLKSSALSVAYHESGAPASLNATIDDHTVQTIANLASIGVSASRLLPARGGNIPGGPVKATICSDEVVNALKALPDAKASLDGAVALVDSRTRELKAIADKIDQMGSNVDQATKTALSKLVSDLGKAKAMLDSAQKAHDKILQVVTHEQSLLWPSKGSESSAAFDLDAATLTSWVPISSDKPNPAETKIFLALRDSEKKPRPDNAPVVNAKLGIPIRQGAIGYLSACKKSDCSSGGEVVAERSDRLLQLGVVYYLPCVSRPFSSVACSYTTSESGALKSAGSSQTSATAESITSALGDLTEKAANAREARQAAKTQQIEAETAHLKAVAAQKEARDALSAVDPLGADKAAAAAFSAQADRLNAERALIEAQNALDAAKRSSQP